MMKKLVSFALRVLICAVIGVGSLLILMTALIFFFHAGDISLSKKIQGNYVLSISTLDSTFIFATVHSSDEASDGRESIRRIGISGKHIYWETYSNTTYCIDTERQIQERVHGVPSDVTLLDPITFWNELHRQPR